MHFKQLCTQNLGPRAMEALEPLFKYAENRLEAKGEWRRAQNLREFQLKWRGVPHDSAKIIETWIILHFKLDLAVQKLANLLSEEESMQGQIETALDQEIAREELESIQEKIMAARKVLLKLQIELHQSFMGIQSGPFKRAVESHHSNDQEWFLSEWIRGYCAARGGCCGRECGCCERPRSGIKTRGIGHCTSACACCEEDRGTHIDTTEKDPYEPVFQWSQEDRTELENTILLSIAMGPV